MPATATRTYQKHDPAKIARKALKLGGTNIPASKLGNYAVIRAGTRSGVIKPTTKTLRTGKRGRPGILYTLTLKGRNVAKKAA
jgi:hypothetical protein